MAVPLCRIHGLDLRTPSVITGNKLSQGGRQPAGAKKPLYSWYVVYDMMFVLFVVCCLLLVAVANMQNYDGCCAIYQILLGWKQNEYYYETVELKLG